MPLPLVPLIAAGAGLLGGGINAASQANQNRKNRAFAREMYERTRADNIEFWNMQNAYNDPAQQMQRLRAAGLNPNMVYGGSSGGTAGTAGSIPTPDVQTPQTRAPEWGNAISGAGLGYINAIYDLEIKQAQTDNLKAQNQVILQDAMLKAAQTKATQVSASRGEFNLGFESELRDTSLQARKEQLRQLQVTTDLSINRDAREAAMNSTSIKEAIERMANMQEQRLTMQLERSRTKEDITRIRAEKRRLDETVEQLKKSNVMIDLDIELRKQGINPQDPMWARVVGRLLSNFFEPDGTFQSTTGNIWSRLFGR